MREVVEQGSANVSTARSLHLKYEGTDTTLEVPAPQASTPEAIATVVAAFEQRYRTQYGFLMPGKPLVIEAVGVEAIGRSQRADDANVVFAPRDGALQPVKMRRIYTAGSFHDAAVYVRDAMRPGDVVRGPAVIAERSATTVVEPGWRATFTARGDLVLERVVPLQRAHAIGTTCDPVLLEVFNNLFMAIAEQMGVRLANTAYSVNIKERLDFSCALFDARRQSDRQRAAHAGAPRIDGREREDHHRAPGGHHARARCLRAQCTVQRRHASARRDRDRARVPARSGCRG